MTPPERELAAASRAGRSRWIRIAVALVGLAVGARALLPIWLASELADRASARLGEPVSVGNVDLALWRSGFAIEDVAIGEDRRLRLAAASTEVDLLAYVRGELRLRRLRVDGPDFELLQTPDGIALFPQQPPSEPEDDAVEGESEPFAIAIEDFSLSRARVRVVDSDTRALTTEFRLAALAVDSLGWRDGSLHLGSLDVDGPELRLGEAALAAEESPAEAEADADVEDAEAFALHIGSIEIASARIVLEDGDADPIVLAIELSADEVGLGEERFPISLSVSGDVGSLEIDGQLATRPASFAGSVDWTDLDLGTVAGFLPSWDARLERALSSGSLSVEWAPDATVIAGKARFADVALQASPDLHLGWSGLELVADRIAIPGAAGSDAAIVIGLERVAWREPTVEWTLREVAADAGEVESSDAVPLVVSVGAFDIDDGNLHVHDLRGDPEWSTRLHDVTVTARSLNWPERNARDVRVSGQGERGTLLAATGNLHRGSGRFQGSVRDLLLPPYNGLVAEQAGIAFEDGVAKVESVVDLDPEGFASENNVVLRDLDLRELESGAFESLFGVPMNVAVTLLRSPTGEIVFPLPVEAHGEEMNVSLRMLVATQLQAAIIGALGTPVKIFGALLPFSRKAADRLHVTTLPGSFRLRGRRALESVVAQLREQPGSSVRVHGRTEAVDDPHLAAAAIHEAIRSGEFAPESPVGDAETTSRLVAALRDLGLEERSRLAVDLHARLSSWASRFPVSAERREALAASRVEAARSALEDAGIAPERVLVGEAQPGAPGVGFAVVAGEPAPVPESGSSD